MTNNNSTARTVVSSINYKMVVRLRLAKSVLRLFVNGITLILLFSVLNAQSTNCDTLRHTWSGGQSVNGENVFMQNFNCSLQPVELVGMILNDPETGPVMATYTGGYPMYTSPRGGYTAQASTQCTTQKFTAELKIHFSKPVRNFAIAVVTHEPVYGETGGPVTGIANTGETVIGDGRGCCNNGMNFQSTGITDVTFTTTTNGGNWYLAMEDLNFSVDPIVCNSCQANAIPKPAPQTVQSNWGDSSKNWNMTAEVTENDGLVLRDIKLGDRYMTEQYSVPYYTLQTTAFPKQRGQLKPAGNDPSMRSRLVNYQVFTDDQKMVIEATYIIDKIPSTSESCLMITQRYEFYKEGVLPCEPSGTVDCSNYRAFVKYKFTGRGTDTLSSINIVQRKRDKINNYSKNTVSLFKDCDGFFGCLSSAGIVFRDKENPLFSETLSNVIANGQSVDTWDNIHQTFLGVVEEPPAISSLVLGGCPECTHNHWRWGSGPIPGFVNAEKFNFYKPFVPNNSTQSLDIAVVKYKTGEEDPLDFRSLVDEEPIRHPVDRSFDLPEQIYDYTAPDSTVTWYSATGSAAEDSFFNSQFFFGASIPYVMAGINRDNAGNQASSSSRSTVINGAAGLEDVPTSVLFANLYHDGATTFADLDPVVVGALPAGYAAYNNTGYGIKTEAEVSGPHKVTFSVPSAIAQSTFENLRILHGEVDQTNPSQTIWVDRTILAPDPSAPDFDNKTLSARVNYLGPFVIASVTEPQTPNSSVAELAVTQTDSADPVAAGSELSYTISVTNNGPQTANEVIVVAGLAPVVDFVSAAPNQGTCLESDGKVICKLGSIAVGAGTSITVLTIPAETAKAISPEGVKIVNTVVVRSNETDNVLTNNLNAENTLLLPNPNPAPSVSITSPTNEKLYVGPTNLTVNMNAGDVNGTVTKVELFDNGELLGEAQSLGGNQYGFTWTNTPFGVHTLVAKATDNGDRQKISSPVTFNINGPATVNIVSPSQGSYFNRPANISISADAAYSGGGIAKVDFYANGILIGQGTANQYGRYTVLWSNAAAGNYQLRAVATDNNGVETISAPVKFIYVNDSPAVSITTPLNGGRVTAPIDLIANASDSDGSVGSVDFYANGAIVARGTYIGKYQFKASWINPAAGTHSVNAVARDNFGNQTTSNAVNFTINAAPTVSITAPAQGTQYAAPGSVTVTASAADADGSVSSVAFYANGSLIGTGSASGTNQYSFTWNNVTTGVYSLTAVATDNDGGAATSAQNTVTVTSPALLVAGSTALSAGDAAIKLRMERLGYIVTVKAASSAVSSDANGKKVVVISSTVTPTSVNTKFRTTAVPVVLWEPGIFYDMGLTAKQNTNFGTTTSQTQISISNPGHYLAGGLTGVVSIATAANTISWGKPNSNAASIATVLNDSSRKVIFAYEIGAAMPGLIAPGRRVGVFMNDTTAAGFTDNGGLLFDTAIKWATRP
ncbi:MAG TPA: Ig-like domain-containing protein [Pyrinomonadaceae bacterium]